jgi:hypothetical protein
MDSQNFINGRLADAHTHFTATFNSANLNNVKPGRAFNDRGRFIGIMLSTHDSAPADQWLPKVPVPVCISGVVAVKVSESVQVGNKAYADSEGKIGIETAGKKLNAIFLENGDANDIVPLLIYGGAA